MSRNTIKITETLMLRRIDPIIMIRRYLSGEFKKVSIPKGKVTFSKAFINLNQRVGSDQTSEIYRFNDKTNSGQVIVTNNHVLYNYVKETRDGKEVVKPVAECKWCRRKYLPCFLRRWN